MWAEGGVLDQDVQGPGDDRAHVEFLRLTDGRAGAHGIGAREAGPSVDGARGGSNAHTGAFLDEQGSIVWSIEFGSQESMDGVVKGMRK